MSIPSFFLDARLFDCPSLNLDPLLRLPLSALDHKDGSTLALSKVLLCSLEHFQKLQKGFVKIVHHVVHDKTLEQLQDQLVSFALAVGELSIGSVVCCVISLKHVILPQDQEKSLFEGVLESTSLKKIFEKV
ncbi:unnamed protein product [Cuscuta campestris]|uniref:Uncharacterized protein n=1 Tax=Cuscuta campestris TaxID=132261 RepID=A0A484MNC3_9ASTE|nr:unnamed protein product [Cuscuta campestris]